MFNGSRQKQLYVNRSSLWLSIIDIILLYGMISNMLMTIPVKLLALQPYYGSHRYANFRRVKQKVEFTKKCTGWLDNLPTDSFALQTVLPTKQLTYRDNLPNGQYAYRTSCLQDTMPMDILPIEYYSFWGSKRTYFYLIYLFSHTHTIPFYTFITMKTHCLMANTLISSVPHKIHIVGDILEIVNIVNIIYKLCAMALRYSSIVVIFYHIFHTLVRVFILLCCWQKQHLQPLVSISHLFRFFACSFHNLSTSRVLELDVWWVLFYQMLGANSSSFSPPDVAIICVSIFNHNIKMYHQLTKIFKWTVEK